MSDHKSLALLAMGQVCFISGLVICIAIKPSGLSANDGVSYYGVYISTFVPYVVCLLGPAVFTLITALRIRKSAPKMIYFNLMIFSLLGLIITATPYSVDGFLDWTHTTAGSILFSLQLVLSAWLMVKLKYSPLVVALTALELVAGILAASYVLRTNGLLIQSQVVFQLAFGALLLYSLNITLSDFSQ